jgi:hypothetical protein
VIPKRIFQCWIGPLKPPQECLDSWRRLNPDCEYQLITEFTGFPQEVQSVLDAIYRANRPDKFRAMTDAIRWFMLWKYGGVAVDADSECVRTLDDWLFEMPEWAAWEHEGECAGVVANGTVGAEPGSLLMSRLVQRLPMSNPSGAPWLEYGPHYLTAEAWGYKGLKILPSRHFLPWHGGLSHPYGKPAPGDHTVYARQFWSSRNGYEGLDVSDPRFVILSTGVKIPTWAPACLESVGGGPPFKQKFACRHIVYTDPETAKVCRDVTRTYERGCLVDIREDRGAALANIWHAIHGLDPETYVGFCDLDDMLLPGALETWRDIVEGDPNLRIGWGQFRYWPTGGTGFASPHPEGVVEHRDYRTRLVDFYATHFRWCKAGLFQELDETELQHADGRWFEYAGDCAMMWSMFERTEAWEQYFCRREMLAYNRRFVDGLTREQYFRTKECESEIRQKPKAPAPLRMSVRKPTRLNVGCGKLRREGWLNLDKTAADGVDLVVDLERDRIPLADDSVDEIRGDHVLEHLGDILPAMQELWRVAKRGALATFVVPLGKLADADPTHVRRFNEQSWGYFGQPKYEFGDYGYRGDWECVSCKREGELMTAVLRAVKPARVA